MARDTQSQERDTLHQRTDFAQYSGENRIGGEPNRIRTCDPLIKSQLLYQLSYGPNTRRYLGLVADGVNPKNEASGGIGLAGLYRGT